MKTLIVDPVNLFVRVVETTPDDLSKAGVAAAAPMGAPVGRAGLTPKKVAVKTPKGTVQAIRYVREGEKVKSGEQGIQPKGKLAQPKPTKVKSKAQVGEKVKVAEGLDAKVTAIGKDGVTAVDDEGNKHQMLHENVETSGGEPGEGDEPTSSQLDKDQLSGVTKLGWGKDFVGKMTPEMADKIISNKVKAPEKGKEAKIKEGIDPTAGKILQGRMSEQSGALSDVKEEKEPGPVAEKRPLPKGVSAKPAEKPAPVKPVEKPPERQAGPEPVPEKPKAVAGGETPETDKGLVTFKLLKQGLENLFNFIKKISGEMTGEHRTEINKQLKEVHGHIKKFKFTSEQKDYVRRRLKEIEKEIAARKSKSVKKTLIVDPINLFVKVVEDTRM